MSGQIPLKNGWKPFARWLTIAGLGALMFFEFSCGGCREKVALQAPKKNSSSLQTHTASLPPKQDSKTILQSKSLPAPVSSQPLTKPLAPGSSPVAKQSSTPPAVDSEKGSGTAVDFSIPPPPSVPLFAPPRENFISPPASSGGVSSEPAKNLSGGELGSPIFLPGRPAFKAQNFASAPAGTAPNSSNIGPANPSPPAPTSEQNSAANSPTAEIASAPLVVGQGESKSSLKTFGLSASAPETPPQDVELTLASAEGILKSQPEHAMMGGLDSLLIPAFREESPEARMLKIQSGYRDYVLDLPDGQARYQAEIPLVWIFYQGNFQTGFKWVELPLQGTQDGRIVRIISCAPRVSTQPWIDLWFPMLDDVANARDTLLAEYCPQPTYRDYRVAQNQLTVDIPVTGRAVSFFVTFNPVEWINPAFQENVGPKQISGDPVPMTVVQFRETMGHAQLMRWVEWK